MRGGTSRPRRGRGEGLRSGEQFERRPLAGRAAAAELSRSAAMNTNGDETIRMAFARTRAQLVEVARRQRVELDAGALRDVARAADFAGKVEHREPIYGVIHRASAAMPTSCSAAATNCRAARSGHAEEQRNLIVTMPVCVGEPFAPEVVRAMLCIRINTCCAGIRASARRR